MKVCGKRDLFEAIFIFKQENTQTPIQPYKFKKNPGSFFLLTFFVFSSQFGEQTVLEMIKFLYLKVGDV